jgi:hypothetical protein
MVTKKLEKSLETRRKNISTALTEIINTVESYFLVAPFTWIEGADAHPGQCAFPEPESRFRRFEGWNERWLGALFPEADKIQEKIKAQGTNIDEIGELAFAAQRFGFLCGVLVGMKALGASRQQLEEKCVGFITSAVSQAESESAAMARKGQAHA